MFPVILAALLGGVLAAVVSYTSRKGRDEALMRLMLAGYLVRLVIHLFVRDLSLFSHGSGGDYGFYEALGVEIARSWERLGIEFITSDVLPALGPTALPPNLFGLVIFMNDGEPTSLGCTAPVALAACLTCLNLYHLAMEFGADPRRSYLLTAALLFSPAFLLYTTDTYKDGLVLFFTVTALINAIRMARNLSFMNAVIGVLCIAALWHVRFYLVFVTTAPLVVGLAGLRTRSIVRPLVATMLLLAVGAFVVASTDVVDQLGETATAAYTRGTSQQVLASNATSGGAGVAFDDGGNPWGAFGPKLAYLLFSPFPWMGGSLGLQIGKVDAFLWYFIMWRAWKSVRPLWRNDKTLLLMLLTFMVPSTAMYAATFANVGLSLRQRMVIVFVTAFMAMLSWRKAEVPERVAAEAPLDPRPKARRAFAPGPTVPAR